MRPFFSACIKLIGLQLGLWGIFLVFSSIFSFISIGRSGVGELSFAIPGLLTSGFQIMLAFLLIFRTDIVLDWAQFPEAQAPNLDTQNVLRIGIILVGLLNLVSPLGDFLGRGLGVLLQGQYAIAPDLRALLPSLLTGLIAFGLIRFSHKLAALIARWQNPPAGTE